MSYEEPKQEMKGQEARVNDTSFCHLPAAVLPSSTASTSQTTHLQCPPGRGRNIFLRWFQENIGPNVEKLINSGETPQQAYTRHAELINAASCRLTSQEQFIRMIEDPAYVNYHIPIAAFDKVIHSVRDLRAAVDISAKSARRLIEFTLEEDSVFARLFCNVAALREFSKHFSREDINRVIQGVFNNEELFAEVFPDESALGEFKQQFPEYADQATALFMIQQQPLPTDAGNSISSIMAAGEMSPLRRTDVVFEFEKLFTGFNQISNTPQGLQAIAELQEKIAGNWGRSTLEADSSDPKEGRRPNNLRTAPLSPLANMGLFSPCAGQVTGQTTVTPQIPRAVNDVNGKDLEAQSDPPKRERCCKIL